MISVVIPCYKQAKFLREAVASVNAQTYSDWEIIMACGDDESFKVAGEIVMEDIFLGSKKSMAFKDHGKGVANAKNEAVRVSRGELILPLDADDMLVPTYMEKVMGSRSGVKNEIVTTWQQSFGDSSEIYQTPPWDDIKTANPCPNTSLYSKTLWEAAGGYDVGLLGFEDWGFWLSCAAFHPRVTKIPEPLFQYRCHKDQGMKAEEGLYDVWKAMLRLRHPELWPGRQYLDKQIVRTMPEAAASRLRQRLFHFPGNKTLRQWDALLT